MLARLIAICHTIEGGLPKALARLGVYAGTIGVTVGQAEMAYSAWALVHGIAMLRITYLVDLPMDLATADREALLTFGRGLQS